MIDFVAFRPYGHQENQLGRCVMSTFMTKTVLFASAAAAALTGATIAQAQEVMGFEEIIVRA
ncbi:MAG: hypothetical protein AAF337_05090, partial [Pseudomonadota bacterium]